MDLHAVCCSLLLLSCTGACFGQELILPEIINTAVGENVVITPIRLPDPPHYVIIWKFNETAILAGPPSGIIIQPPYTDRVSLDPTTYTLELRSLTENDTGLYSLTVETLTNPITGETSLHVFEIISGAALTGPTDDLIEDDSSATLSCKASGTIYSAEWMKDNQKLSASDNITFSNDNRSVMISPVRRRDSGEYKCTLSNPISSDIATYRMTVNFGPDNVIIDGPFAVEEGNKLTLSCRTESTPNASYKWMFNGTLLEVNTTVFTVEEVTFMHTGNYTCMASNPVTGRDASASHILVVKEKGSMGGGGESLSAGAIAGIVIGVLLGVAGIAGLIFYFVKGRK
ncbi:carcinoembryonic antigen-related cell adhesion molecule 20-like isoform X2 [Ictalurus furcatus]|uniref:carcinoembryonic antigen-related cell adhesion molecule 20-like isoform X1 n=1 Tax=Ictalurus furcatus TaxID=66913 RepID=UPI00234FB95F|nr:carcinoembryonic antigen-related cell adhesion molecule 20-like isoform X1 [Ictalurus furcatus]XP_053481154.1 carcinoembryonic antigen-related cell adhesion molecule 20-like isoform X2 [Ictalurus furcatus]